jgi:hypothetical protein
LNSYAYILLRSGKVDEAVKIFKFNTEIYPGYFHVYDSVSNGYEKAGNKALAIESCKKRRSKSIRRTNMKKTG